MEEDKITVAAVLNPCFEDHNPQLYLACAMEAAPCDIEQPKSITDLKRGEDRTLRLTATTKVTNECGCTTCYDRNVPSRSCRRLKQSRDGKAT